MCAAKSPCQTCFLRKKDIFNPFTAHELDFMQAFWAGEDTFERGDILFSEGDALDFFYTVRHGQGARYRHLANGDRQLVNFIFPGDTIGLQGVLSGEASSTAIAAEKMVLCKFKKSRLPELFRESPKRAYSLVWIAAVEEHFLCETITTLGQRNATERMAWAFAKIFMRLKAVGLGREDTVAFPFRQRDMADALGLSLVHTNKTLARLRPYVQWEGGQLRVRNLDQLAEISMIDYEAVPERPLL